MRRIYIFQRGGRLTEAYVREWDCYGRITVKVRIIAVAFGSGALAVRNTGAVFSCCGPYALAVINDASAILDASLPLIDALNEARGTFCGDAAESLF